MKKWKTQSNNLKMQTTINHVMKLREMPNGNWVIAESGTVLTPEQFKKLRALMPDTFWIKIVDVDLQRARTMSKDKLTFNFK